MTAPRRAKGEGYYAYAGLDRVLHEKARLGILTALVARADGATFVELKRLCALTDGNLARHLQTLLEADLIDVEKTADSGRPTTVVRMTKRGRSHFVAYLDELERVIRDARPATAKARRETPPGLAPA